MLKTRSSSRLWAVLAAAVGLVLLGGGVAAWTQTGGGTVQVRDTSFVGVDGHILAAKLYVPDGATAKTPAPGILAVHGYINTAETQDAFAIELSRRGYVVLALDQYGHGNSDPAAFLAGYGGPSALAYLRTLDIVDKDNIGLEGHSMGGWTVVSAAAAFPDGYKSMVLEGSSVGGGVAPDGTTTFPKNVKVVYGTWEEFSPLMWEVANPGDAQSGKKMEAFFGTNQKVETGKIYGSIADGTARQIVRPVSNHPGLTIDAGAVQASVDWFAKTLDGGQTINGQVWGFKEAGTLVGFIGGILSIFAVGGLLLQAPWFRSMVGRVPEAKGAKWGPAWFVGAILAAGIPAVTFFWFNNLGATLLPGNSALWPQQLSNGIMMWALLNGLIAIAILVGTHYATRKSASLSVADYGFTTTAGFRWGVVGKSAVLAVASVGAAYLLLVISDWLFKTDFRLYVLQLHILNGQHFAMFLVYLVSFAIFFLLLAAGMHSSQRWTGRPGGVRREMIANAIVLPLGLVVLLVIDYLPLVLGGTLLIPDQPLLIIVAYPFVPILAIVGILSTFFYHKTGTIYVGAFAAALLVTWNIVGGTASHDPSVTEWGGIAQFLRVILPIIVGLAFLLVALLVRLRAVKAGVYRDEVGPDAAAEGADDSALTGSAAK